MLELGADDALALAQRRDEAQRREHPGAGRDRGAADDLVEALPRQHRQRAGHVDPAAARADAAERRRAPRLGQHLVLHAEAIEGAQRVGDQAVAADLVARKGVLVDQQHVAAGPRQPLRGGAAGGTGADHEHVAARRELADAEVHSSAVGAASRGGVGPIRAAATTAQAVIAPTSAKVSW